MIIVPDRQPMRWQASGGVELRQVAREVLPAPVQDGLRVIVDTLVPSRRQASGARAAQSEHSVELARRVSPSGLVLAGPFAGMWMSWRGSWGGNAARLAGTYEEELTPSLFRLLAGRPSLVIDIGAAEGYYAVGIARSLPETTVIAYDIDAGARRICREAARRNGVVNLDVRGRINPGELRRRLRPRGLVICDCEGCELELIDPMVVPDLLSCSLLVELHEFARPGVTEAVTARFRATHDVTLVDARPTQAVERPQLQHLSPHDAQAAVNEDRPESPRMQWAVMTPRTG